MSQTSTSRMPDLDQDSPLVLFEKGEWVDGFTWQTMVGAIFVGLIMMPGAIYMGLISGVSVGGVAQWVVIIIFIEIGRRSFVKMKRQEIIILFWVSSGVLAGGVAFGSGAKVFGGPFSALIWNQYLIQSPQAADFGIVNEIPSWAAPAAREILEQRSFFHTAWAIPVLLVVAITVLREFVTIGGGYFFYRVCSDIERLPFPMAPVGAGGACALEESSNKAEGWRWRIFSIGAMIGVAYGTIYLVIPTLTGAIAAEPIMIIPIPFADWTVQIGQSDIFAAAIIGLTFDLGLLLSGFVLPFPVVLGGFVGAVLANVVLNPILYHAGILYRWKPGMSAIPTSIINGLDFWISIVMGFGVAVALLGLGKVAIRLIKGRGASAGALTSEEMEDLKGRGDFPLGLTALIVLGSLAGFVVLCHVLVPDFPLWILILFAFIYSPIMSYIGARMTGITGSAAGTSFPFIKEAAFIFSGYKGAAIWFAPVPLFDLGGAETFKQLELTRTKFVSLVKARAMTVLLVLVFSMVFWSLVWRMGRIPSSTYPYVQKMWPFRAITQCLWASSTLASDRLVSDALAHDFEALPIVPNDQVATITPAEGGYSGYLWDFRPEAPARPEDTPQKPPLIAMVGADQPDSILDGFAETDISAVLIVINEDRLTAEETERLRERFIRWPNARYWISKKRAAEFESQLILADEVSVERRENFLLQAINPKNILMGVGIGWVLLLLLAVVGAPISFGYGVLGGVGNWPHMVIPVIIGALLSRYVIAKRVGPNKWRSYTPVLLAGYGCGFGLIGTIATAIALLSKAVSMIVL